MSSKVETPKHIARHDSIVLMKARGKVFLIVTPTHPSAHHSAYDGCGRGSGAVEGFGMASHPWIHSIYPYGGVSRLKQRGGMTYFRLWTRARMVR